MSSYSSGSDSSDEFVTIDRHYNDFDYHVRETSPVPSLNEGSETEEDSTQSAATSEPHVPIISGSEEAKSSSVMPVSGETQSTPAVSVYEVTNTKASAGRLTSEIEASNYNHSVDQNSENVRKTEPKELNVLVIGETGVGKSTWINATANYLTHKTISDALFGEEIAPIASKFIITDDNLEEHIIEIGSSANESDTTTGQSGTQSTKTYLMKWEDSKGQPYLIRLIDTPGIGDVRGPDFDKSHISNILHYLSILNNLHGICILLKPDTTRLNLIFQYCLNELLSHLHKNTANNIVFVFTNARSSNFKAGNTMPILREYLRKIEDKQNVNIPTIPETVYCLDNEAFRYLCASRKKNLNISFDDEEQENYRKSWDRSRKETNRMFEHITTREPHTMTDTLTMNDARRLILTLAKPLADITSNIQTNTVIIEERRRLLETYDQKDGDLLPKLLIPMTSLETEPLGYPRTVCIAGSCIETKQFGNTRTAEIIYKTHCHSRCNLKNIVSEIVPEPKLRGCTAMGGKENCQVCGCRWNQHMHITYGQHQKEIEVKDPNIERLIQQNASQKDVILAAIEGFTRTINELKFEQHRITTSSVKFGIFLKENAILPYNDVFEEYLNLKIQEELRIVEITRNEEKLIKLRSMLDEYREERRVLEETMNVTGESILPSQIAVMNYELITLKHKGPEIAQMLGVALEAQDRMLQHQEMLALPAPQNEPPPPYSSNTRSRALIQSLLDIPSTSSRSNNVNLERLREIFKTFTVATDQ